MLWILRASHFGIEKRALKMYSQACRTALGRSHPRATDSPHLVPLCGAAELGKLLLGTREAGREEPSDAVLKLAAADHVECFVCRIAEVVSAASVGMDVDEPREKRESVGLYDLVARDRANIGPGSCNAAVFNTHTRNTEIFSRCNDSRPYYGNVHLPAKNFMSRWT